MTKANQDETEQEPRRRAKRNRAEPKLYISFLPDGRGGPREDKGSVPLEVDVEAHIEERRDCDPGEYRIEKKRSGEFSGEVLFYRKDEDDAPATIGEFDDFAGGDDATDMRKLVVSTVNATLEAREKRERGQLDPMDQFRQMRELLKEEREEMQRQMAQQSGAAQDPLTMFERVVELQKKMQPEVRESSEPELSAKDRAQLMLVKETGIIPEFMRSMRDMLRAPEEAAEPKSIVEKAMDYLREWTPYLAPVVAPVLGQKISDVVSRVNVDALAQRMNKQGGPSAAAEAPTLSTASADSPPVQSVEVELFDALGIVVDCMTLDTDDSDGQEHVDTAANALRSFVLRNPVAAPAVDGLFTQASASLVLQLAASKPEWAYVAKLGNSADFISRLKGALAGPEAPPSVNDVPLSTPSANGAKAAKSVG